MYLQGQSTGAGSSTTLVDTSKTSMIPNLFNGYQLAFTGGTGAGQIAQVLSHTGGAGGVTYTFAAAVTTPPDATTTYVLELPAPSMLLQKCLAWYSPTTFVAATGWNDRAKSNNLVKSATGPTATTLGGVVNVPTFVGATPTSESEASGHPANSFLMSQSFTAVVAFFPTSSAARQFLCGTVTGTAASGWSLFYDPSQAGSSVLEFNVQGGGAGVIQLYKAFGFPSPLNAWQVVAASYSGGGSLEGLAALELINMQRWDQSFGFYGDQGYEFVYNATSVFPGALGTLTNANGFFVGATPGGTLGYTGGILEVQLYSPALKTEEIREISQYLRYTYLIGEAGPII